MIVCYLVKRAWSNGRAQTALHQVKREMNSNLSSQAGRLDLVRWLDLPSHGDSRGVLTAVEGNLDLPFEIKRVYLLHQITAERGGHAHRDTHQLIVAVSGQFKLLLSDGNETQGFVLDTPTRGLLLGPMLFIRMVDFAPDARAMVLASTHYDCARSIRSWDAYLEAIRP